MYLGLYTFLENSGRRNIMSIILGYMSRVYS